MPDLVGASTELDVGPIAHGGHCVARWNGQVVFVRHALPGERVRATITGQTSRYLRADAVEVLTAVPGRTESRCPVSGAGGCGGCDFQHVELATQRLLLGEVVADQLRRIAGIERDVVVEDVENGDIPGRDGPGRNGPGRNGPGREGLDWRTRMSFAVDADGMPGLHRHRSHDVIPLEDCPIAHPGLPGVLGHRWQAEQVESVMSSNGDRLVVATGTTGTTDSLPALEADGVVADGRRARGRTYVRERVHGREFRVSGPGFWQVHPRAAETLVDVVLQMTGARTGDAVADLYAGVGLFSAFLGEAVGAQGSVVSVEGDERASRDARRNLHDLSQVRLVHADVKQTVPGGTVPAPCDHVVLDPPRSGAGGAVVRGVAELRPRRVVYVACDPAALARDVATFGAQGYELTSLRAFDLFPMTHHVECVALLTPVR